MDKNERKDLMMDLFIDNENKASKLRCNNCNFSKDNEEVTCHCEIYDSAVLNDEGIHCMYNSAKEENEEMTKDIALGRFFTNDCLSTIRCGSCVFSSYNKLDLSLINNIDVKEQEQCCTLFNKKLLNNDLAKHCVYYSTYYNTWKPDKMYFHCKYSDDGGESFTAFEGRASGLYLGTYTDNKEEDSLNPEDYTWKKSEKDD